MVNYVFVEFLSGKSVVQISDFQEYSYFSIFLEFIGVLGLQDKKYEDWKEQSEDSILYFEYGDTIHLSNFRADRIHVLDLLNIRKVELKDSSIFPSFQQYRQTIQQRAATLINQI